MTQEEKWQANYEEVVAFIKKNHRNPSKQLCFTVHDEWFMTNDDEIMIETMTRKVRKRIHGTTDGRNN